jgi:hypothetical protein
MEKRKEKRKKLFGRQPSLINLERERIPSGKLMQPFFAKMGM